MCLTIRYQREMAINRIRLAVNVQEKNISFLIYIFHAFLVSSVTSSKHYFFKLIRIYEGKISEFKQPRSAQCTRQDARIRLWMLWIDIRISLRLFVCSFSINCKGSSRKLRSLPSRIGGLILFTMAPNLYVDIDDFLYRWPRAWLVCIFRMTHWVRRMNSEGPSLCPD